jgi:carbonic anhydrase/acetyltransferase-like protein (isoleucine patch superfamily)
LKISDNAFIAPNATVIGDVAIGDNSSIWYGTVLRGDTTSIAVGDNTNIQDNSVVHPDNVIPVVIGSNVTIGHGAIIHACTIEDNVLVGMGSIILDGALVGRDSIIGAGSLIPPGKTVPSGTLVMGSPFKVVRQLTPDEIESIRTSAESYVSLMGKYIKQGV